MHQLCSVNGSGLEDLCFAASLILFTLLAEFGHFLPEGEGPSIQTPTLLGHLGRSDKGPVVSSPSLHDLSPLSMPELSSHGAAQKKRKWVSVLFSLLFLFEEFVVFDLTTFQSSI